MRLWSIQIYMTTSIRSPYGDKWNYERHEFKPFDPFKEPQLISIIFLACGKSKITKLCLEATAKAAALYGGELEWVFMENGDCQENWQLFDEFKCERKTLIKSRNFGICHGFNQMLAVSRGEFVMFHENDFRNQIPDFNFLQHAKDILNEQQDIGLVRLRDPYDPYENWGKNKKEYEPMSCPDAKVWRAATLGGHLYYFYECPNGFNNNPNLVRRSLLNEVGMFREPIFGSDPRHGEQDFQERVRATDALTGYIGVPVYHHIGGGLRLFYERN